MNAVALIPARAGSKRLPGKNTRVLGGFPLIVWSIWAAFGAGLKPYVSTEDHETALLADKYGARVIKRPEELASDASPDIEWVRHAIDDLKTSTNFDTYVLLRPTSPFRTAETVRRALERFGDVLPDSLRSVERVKQHPYKMWTILEDGRSATQWMTPFATDYVTNNLLLMDNVTPFHSRPTQSLPPVYVQNASLEIFSRATVERTGTISGTRIVPFYTTWPEGVDINDEQDWREAEHLAATGHLLSIK